MINELTNVIKNYTLLYQVTFVTRDHKNGSLHVSKNESVLNEDLN